MSGEEECSLLQPTCSACSAYPQELEKAVLRGQELGDRLEHLQEELEQAALERQKFLQEQENQHQRWARWLGGRD